MSDLPTGQLPLAGQPGVPDGLMAYAMPRPDGTYQHDRKGRPRTRRVQLRREHDDTAPRRPDRLLSDAQWRWATSAPRRWPTITRKFGDQAESVALALTRAGCVRLDHDYVNGAIQQPPRGWTPDPRLAEANLAEDGARQRERSRLDLQAQALAAELIDDWPGVAAALTTPASEMRLTWLVHAASDLADGCTHDSARAFVQSHASHTKARDDVTRLLIDGGFEPAALAQLGISRSPYVGLGGPVRVHRSGRTLDCTGFPGPHDVRLPPGDNLSIDIAGSVRTTLLVVENRQAAEAICDSHPELPIIWSHGQPPEAVLTLIVQAACQVAHVIICPDADLGGVRIAARIHDRLPGSVPRTVVDIGTVKHAKGREFSSHSRTHLERLAGRGDPIGHIARACLDRGYVIEQEASVRAALQSTLTRLV